MTKPRADSQQRLELEIAMLRSRLEGAEEMQRAIAGGEIDGFVVGVADDSRRVMLMDTASQHHGQIVQRMEQGAATVSKSGDILYANQRFASLLGEPLSKLFSSSLHRYVDDEYRGGLDLFLLAATPDSTFDAVFRGVGGGAVAVRLTVASHGDDNVSLLVGHAVRAPDATHETALQAIQDGEIDGFVVGGEHVMLLGDAYRPYQAMIDRMQQGAVTVSDEGEVLYVNDRFTAMAGVARERLLGRRIESCFVPGDHAALRDVLRQSRRERGQAELSLGADGTGGLPVLVTGAGVGTSGAVILMFTDLTEQRRHHEIEEADRRKDEFLAVLAHELRNPLAPIRNAVQVLNRLPGLDPVVRDSVDIIERQSATLTRLLDDLLDIKRLNHGKITLRRQSVDLVGIVHTAVEAARPLLDERRHALHLDLPAQPLHAHGDPVRLVQVVLNLLTNAAKYTPPGGNIRVGLREGSTDEAAPTAWLRVVDDGIGIPAAQLRKVFEPYSQLGESRDTMTAGLGLGLTVVRQLLELHGGSIDAHSDGAGRGSAFVICLPIVAGAGAAEPAVPAATDPDAAASLRILVADDNADGARSLALLLQLSGHETRIANDGLEALRIADEFKPRIAFLDLGMPGLDGFGVARALRKRPWAADGLSIFALTGWSQPDDTRRVEEAGFDAHLVKPFDATGLNALLASARRRWRR